LPPVVLQRAGRAAFGPPPRASYAPRSPE